MTFLMTNTGTSSTHDHHHASGASTFHWSSVEMFLMRLGFAVLVFFAIKWEVGALDPADPKKLTGLTHFINLDWLRNLQPIWIWQTITGVGLLLYVTGIFPVLGLTPALFFSIGIGTLANSQGAANHSTQLVSMILLAQFLVFLLPKTGRVPLSSASWLKPSTPLLQRSIYVTLVVFVASYVICGYTKLHNSDWQWIQRVPNLALELQKTNWSAYYDTLSPVPESLNTVVKLMTEYPNTARLFFGAGLFLELFAFVAMIGRRWSFFTGIAIIIFHLSVSRLMQLDFNYHMAAALIFLVNLPGVGRTFFARKRWV
ncbi:hypothetical protein BH11VER1_BH11VER1_28570 [soil metagenome]